jgi:hypothetical protein
MQAVKYTGVRVPKKEFDRMGYAVDESPDLVDVKKIIPVF